MSQSGVQASLSAHLRRIAAMLERQAEAREPGAAVAGAGAGLCSTADLTAPQTAEGSPLALLCATFDLTPFERDVLLLCAGVELDSECAGLVSRLQDGSPPTFSLALGALAEPHWSALLPTGALRYWRLVEIAAGPSLVASPIRIDERILHHLVGLQYVDERLGARVAVAEPPPELVPSHRAVAERIAAIWQAAYREGSGLPVIQLCGADLAAQGDVAAFASALAGSPLLVLHASALPANDEASDRVWRLWEREALIVSASRLLVLDVPAGADEAGPRRLDGLIEAAAGPLILSTTAERMSGTPTMVTLEVDRPASDERLGLWQNSLGTHAGDAGDLRRLSFQFDLTPAAIRAVAAAALADASPEGGNLAEALWQGSRRAARRGLDDAGARVEAKAGWNDLVLPERERETLASIVEQVRHRHVVHGDWISTGSARAGPGIAALFAGPGGTGKTLAAEVLAAELNLDLYRIDLGALVSKYIGETEKNLRRVFESAEAGGAILLFEEADALFGRRGEVGDSHDRYAGIDAGSLFRRIETYSGLAILTTNLKAGIDEAFLRRLRFVVEFPAPDCGARRQIWGRAFPAGTPREGLDYERLAQLEVSGGCIRDIALGAAFRAAADGSAVSMDHVRQAARAEYAKLGKELTAAETRGWE
ncbi:MAG TPA: ATP-binding protein [Allosphingosinicella sp.]|nr:ATP-binding protein [Allosphingosinicella sp.]